MFDDILEVLKSTQQLSAFRSFAGHLLMPLDGTESFHSTKIHCPHCSTRVLKSGETRYFHTVVTPVIACPGHREVIPLIPEFVVPQDGHDQQDCENAAAKRWLHKHSDRYLNQVLLRDSDDALLVNWCEVVITDDKGKILYQNAFATNHLITHETIEAIVTAGRTRWKVENANNNTLKTKGYNLEHNFGHGHHQLASFLATLNILSLLFHTLLALNDTKYRLLRAHLSTRKTFFNDLRALTRYVCFDNWDHLLTFMIEGLELEMPADTS